MSTASEESEHTGVATEYSDSVGVSDRPKTALGYVSWALVEAGRAPYVGLLVFLFVPYVGSEIVGDPVSGQSLFGLTIMMSGLAIGLSAPFLGAIAGSFRQSEALGPDGFAFDGAAGRNALAGVSGWAAGYRRHIRHHWSVELPARIQRVVSQRNDYNRCTAGKVGCCFRSERRLRPDRHIARHAFCPALLNVAGRSSLDTGFRAAIRPGQRRVRTRPRSWPDRCAPPGIGRHDADAVFPGCASDRPLAGRSCPKRNS